MAKSSTANRGLSFEKRVQEKCDKLKQEGKALISKVPTEWTVLRKFIGGKSQIYNAFPKQESKFVDFVGVMDGRAIAIECKETNETTRFPFSNIKDSQIEFIDLWNKLGGSGYYLIKFTKLKEIYLIPGEIMNDCIRNIGRKSAPHDWFKETEGVVLLNYRKLNFEEYI